MSKSIISKKKSFLDLTSSELNEIFLDVGEKRFRIKQINNWIYNQNVRSWDEMINLPLSLKPMVKTLKHVSCKDRNCSLKKLRILPLISFIGINLIIATSFGLFCYHNI